MKLSDGIDCPAAEVERKLTCSPPEGQEVATLPGTHPGTALRVNLHAGSDGHVRLEQLAYNATLGWYVQKSFCIPVEMLGLVATELRKADCMVPRTRKSIGAPLRFPDLTSPSQPPSPQRREA